MPDNKNEATENTKSTGIAEKVGAKAAPDKSSAEGAIVEPPAKAAVSAPKTAPQRQELAPRDPPPRSDERLRPPNSAKELLIDQMAGRARRANPRLKEHLAGQVFVEIVDSSERYLCDWRTADLKTALVPALPKSAPVQTDLEVSECTIRISEDNLLRVANGDLNPQVGMLSEKIKVSGRLSMAVYFFNLIAP